MRYIQSFSTSGDVQTAIYNGSLGKPYVAYIIEDDVIDWDTKEIDYSKIPLTFKILSDGKIKFSGSDSQKTIYYSLNGSEYVEYTSTKLGAEIDVNSGDIVRFKGDLNAFGYNAGSWFGTTTANYIIYGNIMSLLYGDDFIGKTAFKGGSSAVFKNLFRRSATLYDARNLILPASILVQDCYYQLFSECVNLTAIPELPATTLAVSCYQYMYNGCTSLTSVPSGYLPVTAVVNSCYAYMFNGCTRLTTAPELPATTLDIRCYQNMFNGCTNINYIKCLATDISASDCTYLWVGSVASSGTFVKNPNMSSWTTGPSGIPNGWTVQDA